MRNPLDLMKKDDSAAFTMMEIGPEKKEEKMSEKMLDAATEEILDALGMAHDKKDDLANALKNFIAACGHMEEDDEEY